MEIFTLWRLKIIEKVEDRSHLTRSAKNFKTKETLEQINRILTFRIDDLVKDKMSTFQKKNASNKLRRLYVLMFKKIIIFGLEYIAVLQI